MENIPIELGFGKQRNFLKNNDFLSGKKWAKGEVGVISVIRSPL